MIARTTEEERKANKKARRQTPEYKAQQKAYNKAYNHTQRFFSVMAQGAAISEMIEKTTTTTKA